MTARRLTLSQADCADWAHYTRHVMPLRGRARPAAPPATTMPRNPAGAVPALPPGAPTATPRRTPPARTEIGIQPPGLDNATWHKFRAGKMAPQRTLDLHGRTAERAYHALEAFLRAAHSDGLRCVEVITGRGAREGAGVLRREVPLWLNLPHLRPLVLAAAHPHAGNPGAVRLLVRRMR
jgi:DNA-nicking Smr family endonuclease